MTKAMKDTHKNINIGHLLMARPLEILIFFVFVYFTNFCINNYFIS